MVNPSSFGNQGIEAGVSFRTVGPTDGPVLVLGNSLGTDSRLWSNQVSDWARDHRVVCFEYPGHGSPAWSGEQTVQAIAHRVAALLDHLEVDTYSYCGLSMGGAIGMQLAASHATRLKRLVLSNTASGFGSPEFWAARGNLAVDAGLAALADATIGRWFTQEFVEHNREIVEFYRTMLCAVDPAGYQFCCRAVGAFDFTAQLGFITQPTLIIAGTRDTATTVDQAKSLSKAIPNATYVEFDTGHLGNVGAPEAYASVVRSFTTTTSQSFD